ncbi:TIGR01777 family oxidoreductase [uncultured Friedmanniella sp.]|uniref:TIGR01777 family oxidoreductase n=1 Tax=uncultured Friedmanniella sp. TaxID=335381 RepID=UPI0035CABA1E
MTRWLLAGASGFLGTELRVRLAEQGHEVLRLVRREPASATERRWDPAAGELDPAVLDGVGVVVNLAGAPVFTRPWTTERRELLLSSRVQTTTTIARALAARAGEGTSRVLLQASGVAWYGTDARALPATEDSPAAADFLAQLTVQWEAAAQPAVDAGVRTVLLRTSPVLDRSGGSFVPMFLAWSAGLGTTLGSGQQRMPMISLEDYLGIALWAAATPGAQGPYNLTIPRPTTNADFTTALAAALHRPRLLKAPAFVLRRALGELSEQLVGDCYVVPERLTRDGYVFAAADVEQTIASALHR